MNLAAVEHLFVRMPRGFTSRLRLFAYAMLGMKLGKRNRMEGGGRVRRCAQIEIGSWNAFSQGAWLWPIDAESTSIRIRIGSHNYFNRNVMIDSCGSIVIGSYNMFGPDIYITDSDHRFGDGLSPGSEAMDVGKVRIGDRCWIGAKAVILGNVELGDGCVVGAGAVVTRDVPSGAVVGGVPARVLTPHKNS